MDATLAIALVGAVTGGAGFAWQIYTWFSERKPKIRVTLALAYLTGADLSVLSITVANDNDYAVRVNSTGFVTQDGTGRDLVVLHQLPGASIPGSIPGHDEGMAFLEKSTAEQDGIDLFRPLVAWANVASVGRFESKQATIFVR